MRRRSPTRFSSSPSTASSADEEFETRIDCRAWGCFSTECSPGYGSTVKIGEDPRTPPSGENTSMNNVANVRGAQAVRIDDDFHAWLLEQASLLRKKQYPQLDWNNLAEELEAMAGAQKRELRERLATLFEHLLKLEHQPETRRERNRKNTIVKTRTAIESLLEYSPGLKAQLEALATKAYADGCKHAGTDLGLSRRQWEKTFPRTSPWSVDQILDDDFFPSSVKS